MTYILRFKVPTRLLAHKKTPYKMNHVTFQKGSKILKPSKERSGYGEGKKEGHRPRARGRERRGGGEKEGGREREKESERQGKRDRLTETMSLMKN